MAEPVIPPKGPPGASSGPLANLSPRQRRYVLVAGVAGFLALVVLLGRRTAPPAAAAETVGETYDPSSVEGSVVDPYALGFPADNGAAMASFQNAVVDSLEELTDQVTGLPNPNKGHNQLAKQNKALQRRVKRLTKKVDRLDGPNRGGGKGRDGKKPRNRLGGRNNNPTGPRPTVQT